MDTHRWQTLSTFKQLIEKEKFRGAGGLPEKSVDLGMTNLTTQASLENAGKSILWTCADCMESNPSPLCNSSARLGPAMGNIARGGNRQPALRQVPHLASSTLLSAHQGLGHLSSPPRGSSRPSLVTFRPRWGCPTPS
jgi:hypothetical protein